MPTGVSLHIGLNHLDAALWRGNGPPDIMRERRHCHVGARDIRGFSSHHIADPGSHFGRGPVLCEAQQVR